MGDGTRLIKVMDKMSKAPLKDTSDIVIGTVISISPLQVKVGDKLILTEEFIMLSPFCVEKKIDLNHTHAYSGGTTQSDGPGTDGIYTLWRGLQAGDVLLMLKAQSGQLYYALQRQE